MPRKQSNDNSEASIIVEGVTITFISPGTYIVDIGGNGIHVTKENEEPNTNFISEGFKNAKIDESVLFSDGCCDEE
jgi:hypothetical protein